MALSRADRRSADDRDPTAAVARFRRAVVTYLDVGAWSGRTYPLGAVVAGYDGKEHGRAALVWAAQEAARRDAPLVVLHAANYPGMTGPPGTGLHHRDPGALEAADELTARGVAEAVAAVPGLDVLGATEVASAGRALVEASRKASLVVLGSRGHRRLVGTWRRSVGLEVTSRAYSPVVVVRGESAAVHVTRADLLGPPLDCRRGARG
nr:universal stress protein [Nocardioides lijunqiniae]